MPPHVNNSLLSEGKKKTTNQPKKNPQKQKTNTKPNQKPNPTNKNNPPKNKQKNNQTNKETNKNNKKTTQNKNKKPKPNHQNRVNKGKKGTSSLLECFTSSFYQKRDHPIATHPGVQHTSCAGQWSPSLWPVLGGGKSSSLERNQRQERQVLGCRQHHRSLHSCNLITAAYTTCKALKLSVPST